MDYFAPTTLPDALRILSSQDVSVLAGGTDYYPALQGLAPKRSVLDITRVADLEGISHSKGATRIGALATWSDVVAADLPSCFDALKAAAREVGSIQIQNSGTVVGNLCNASPAADGVPPLLTLDATVEVSSTQSARLVPLADFLLGVRKTGLTAREMVTAIHIPDMPDHAVSGFDKLGSRRYLVISIAMVAVILGLDSDSRINLARVAVGACSPVAQRLPQLEAQMIGMTPSAVAVTAADLAGLAPIDDVRGSGAYRLHAVAQQCRRLILRIGGDDG